MLLRKKILLRLLCVTAICCAQFLCTQPLVAQQPTVGNLYQQLRLAQDDSARYVTGFQLYTYYEEINRDSALYFAEYGLRLARNNDRRLNIVISLSQRAYQLLSIGKYGESLQNLFDAYTIAEDPASERYGWVNDTLGTPHKRRLYALAYAHGINGVLMSRIQNTEQEIFHFSVSKQLATELRNSIRLCLATMNLGKAYLTVKQYDSTLLYEQQAEDISMRSGFTKFMGFIYYLKGLVYVNRKDTALAKKTFYNAINWGWSQSHYSSFAASNYELAKIYLKQNKTDSALYYAKHGLQVLQHLHAPLVYGFTLANAYEILSQTYQRVNRPDSASWYQVMALQTKDSIYSDRINNLSAFHNLMLKETLRLQDIEKEKKIYQQRVRNYGLLIGIALLLLIMFFLFRNNRQRRRTNRNLHAAQSELIKKNRELEIEAGLERVRARAMAMHNSEELKELISTVFVELTRLDFVLTRCTLMLFDPETRDCRWWMIHSERPSEPASFLIPWHEHPAQQSLAHAWETRAIHWEYVLEGTSKKEWDDFLFTQSELAQLPSFVIEGMRAPDKVILSGSFNSFGALNVASLEPLPEELFAILVRFAKVFELSYTRFNDLKQAEAQTREAQIQLSLERVRAKTMSMHRSNDLLEVITVLSEQFTQLGFKIDSANFNTSYREKDWDLWLYNPGAPLYPEQIHIPYIDHPYFNQTIESIASGEELVSLVFDKKEKDAFLDHLYTNTIARHSTEERKNYCYNKPGFAWSVVYLKNTAVTIANYDAEPYTEEQNAILRKFGNAFEQSYTRFLELQKAEAQAREALIEAGLERVRYSAMAMQSSEDVASATAIMFNEISLLGVEAMRCGITVIHPDRTADVWAATTTAEGKQMKGMGSINFGDHSLWVGLFEAWKNKEEYYTYSLQGDGLRSYYRALASSPNYDSSYIQQQDLPDQFFYACFFEQGAVFTFSLQPHDDEKRKVIKKFTDVFSLTFRRYLDLKQAEAQAREAEIQLSLERVRARTMAMQRSEELAETSMLLFEEYHKLSIFKPVDGAPTPRASIGFFDEAAGVYDFWLTGIDGTSMANTYRVSLDEPVNISHAYKAWKEGRSSYVADIQGTQLDQWLDLLQEAGVPMSPGLRGGRRVNHFAFFSKGNLGISTNEPVPEESLQLLQRFAETFNITYTRFLDLKDAETRAREAVKEASLDRVRAEIASMRNADDLQRITPLVWRELTALGVPFLRCGVFIVDDARGRIQFYLSSPEGKPLAVLDQRFDESEVTRNVTEHWRKQETYTTHWSQEEFLRFAQDLVQQGQVTNVEQYQGGDDAPASLSLQFMPFAQGMMYVGSAGDLSQNQLVLVQSLADAFSTAYARYEDFVRLEAAKVQIETTLKDLRDTQTQLVQSEKMASLGELTAGIAHEIQNPLNFVNNFSELNKELMDELIGEIEAGNMDEVKLIAKDIAENSEKINHHGKRADGIVKGMLQHSRASTGQRELVDINALCDEFLRLAFHGLRAKDKSFNASFETDFDASAGKINVQPQEIGRVVLNLINNAFYAVNEKKKQLQDGYQPRVIVRTRKTNGSLDITVEDNGTGIPQKVLDKIFQPFFTTKPTGKGTGLGLSLSYDIVKAHGGELSAMNGEAGALFKIKLPNA